VERPHESLFPRYESLREKLGELRLPTDRDIDLLALEPVARSTMAAIVLSSHMLVRKDWSEIAEVPKKILDRLEVNAPPVPRSDDRGRFDKREHRYRDPSAKEARCTLCFLEEGLVRCGLCHGTRMRVADDGVSQTPCELCSASGRTPCPNCEGVGRTFLVEIHHATDTPIHDRRVVVPSLVGDLDDQVARTIALIADLPDAFRIELQPTMVASAYRGAAGLGKPDFFGFEYLDAYDRARASVPKAPRNMILREDHAWGWPFLCVRWLVDDKNVDVGIVSDAIGNLTAVFATRADPA
jgi:hypothetical protein